VRGEREQSDKQTHRQSLAQQPQPSGPGGTEGQTPPPHIPTAAGCPRAVPPEHTHTHTHAHTHTAVCSQPAVGSPHHGTSVAPTAFALC